MKTITILSMVLASVLVLSLGVVVAEQANVEGMIRTISAGEGQGEMAGEAVQTMTQLQAGVYNAGEGMQIQVQARENNRVSLKAGNAEADTELEVSSDGQNLKAKLSNGRNASIMVMPDRASETALAQLRLRVCTEESGCTIELKQVGEGNEAKLAYELQTERHSRVLGIFPAKMQVRAQVDAETGEVLKVGKPWWAFLAAEPEEQAEE